MLAEIYRQVNHPAMVLVFDGGNMLAQGYSLVGSAGAIHGHEARSGLDARQGLSWSASGDQGGTSKRTRWRFRPAN